MSPRILTSWCGLLALAATSLFGTERADLGDNIVYVRPAALADSAAPSTAALVLDLRFDATPTPPAAARELLTARARVPLVVMLASEPSPAWRALLAAAGPAVLTLAPAGAAQADLTAPVSPAENRAGYDALSAGIDPQILLHPPQEKERRDEAALARERNGAPSPRPRPNAPEAHALESPADAPPTDPLLRRAVQIIVGLRILGHG